MPEKIEPCVSKVKVRWFESSRENLPFFQATHFLRLITRGVPDCPRVTPCPASLGQFVGQDNCCVYYI